MQINYNIFINNKIKSPWRKPSPDVHVIKLYHLSIGCASSLQILGRLLKFLAEMLTVLQGTKRFKINQVCCWSTSVLGANYSLRDRTCLQVSARPTRVRVQPPVWRTPCLPLLLHSLSSKGPTCSRGAELTRRYISTGSQFEPLGWATCRLICRRPASSSKYRGRGLKFIWYFIRSFCENGEKI